MIINNSESYNSKSQANKESFDFSKQSSNIHKLQLERINDIKLVKQYIIKLYSNNFKIDEELN